MLKSIKYRIGLLMSSSILMGIFISFYFVFVNSEFLKVVTPTYLPYTFICAGIFGYLFSLAFNFFENKIGIKKASFLINLIFSISVLLIWFFYRTLEEKFTLIFFSYTWFWITSSIVILSFWKIPTRIFNLQESKKYNSKISIGEVFSAISVYLIIIPLSKKYELLKIEDYILISSISIFLYSLIFLFFRDSSSSQKKEIRKLDNKTNFKKLFGNQLFRYLFFSIIFAMVIQLMVDFSLMNITKENSSKVGNIATFFSIVYGFMRILEFLFKIFIANNVIKQYGIFGSFYSMIFTMGLIYVIGLTTHVISDDFGLVALILAIAAIGKVMERSINRSMYLPAQNILFQAYEGDLKNISQSYSSGYGKPLGQLIGGLIMCVFIWIKDYETTITLLFSILIFISLLWYFNTKKLKDGYNIQLKSRIDSMSSLNKQINLNEKPVITEEEIHTIEPVNLIEQASKKAYLKFSETKELNDLVNVTLEWEKIIYNDKTLNDFIKDDKCDYPISIYILNFLSKNNVDLKNKPTLSLFYFNQNFYHVLNNILNEFELNKIEYYLNYYQNSFDDHKYDINYKNGFINLKKIYFNKLSEKDSKKFLTQLSHENLEILNETIKEIRVDLSKTPDFINNYQSLLKNSINQFCIILSSIVDLKEFDSFEIYKVLKLELTQAKSNIIAVLALKYNKNQIFKLQQLLISNHKEVELIGAEMLDLILDEDDKNLVSEIFKSQKRYELLKNIESNFPQTTYSIIERLKAIVFLYKNELNYITRLTALNELVTKFPKEISSDELKYLCFSREKIIKHLSFKELETKFKSESIEFKSRINYSWRDNMEMNNILELLNKKSIYKKQLNISEFIPDLYKESNMITLA